MHCRDADHVCQNLLECTRHAPQSVIVQNNHRVLQEDFLLCMHKRMEDILQEAEAIADLMAPAANPAALQGQSPAPKPCNRP